MTKENIVLKYLRKEMDFPNVWCPGCGHGIVLTALVRAIAKTGWTKDEIVMVSGIGCSSRAPAYLDFHTLHTLHGRAIPFATGVKLGNPKLKVIVITGDGDGTAIGGNHFIHVCRRNIDLTVILFNNNIYGMTGGQYSPTTPSEAYSVTTPFGNIDRPFDISKVAEAAGATFVARSTAFHAAALENYIYKGFQHKGIAIIEAMTQCPTCYGRKNELKDGVAMMKWFKDHSISKAKFKKLSSESPESIDPDDIVTGIFVERDDIPEYIESYQNIVNSLLNREG
ncbi:2-oxoacid:ferredoxin oxidoreductase subunit beta [Candidatus Dependentiae bacterium]|nr:2-oxoacid:ferredoxin oxidoreductase subunit beta [Candidatus Dependentiae bacterium]